MIGANGLEKSVETTEVIKGIDVAVRRGEIFALLGSSGAGKDAIIKVVVVPVMNMLMYVCVLVV